MRGRGKRKAPRLMSVEIEPAIAGRLVRDHADRHPPSGDPVSARGWIDGNQRWRRLKAAYADGWKVTFAIRADGSYSVSWGLKLSIGGPGR